MRSSGTRTTSSLSSTSSSWCTWSGMSPMFVCGFISSFVWVFLHCWYISPPSQSLPPEAKIRVLLTWNIGDSHWWLETSVCSFSYSIFTSVYQCLAGILKKMTLLSSFQCTFTHSEVNMWSIVTGICSYVLGCDFVVSLKTHTSAFLKITVELQNCLLFSPCFSSQRSSEVSDKHRGPPSWLPQSQSERHRAAGWGAGAGWGWWEEMQRGGSFPATLPPGVCVCVCGRTLYVFCAYPGISVYFVHV